MFCLLLTNLLVKFCSNITSVSGEQSPSSSEVFFHLEKECSLVTKYHPAALNFTGNCRYSSCHVLEILANNTWMLQAQYRQREIQLFLLMSMDMWLSILEIFKPCTAEIFLRCFATDLLVKTLVSFCS